MDQLLNQQALYFEKQAAKKTSNKVGLGILLFLAIENFITLGFSIFILLFPQYSYLVKDSVFNYIYSSLISLLCYLLCGIVIIKSQKRKINDIIAFSKPKAPVFPLVMIGLGVCMFSNIVAGVFASFMPFELKMPQLETPTNPFGAAVYIISASLFPAFLEEFFFRGAIYGSLKKFGKVTAVVVSSILFSLIHGNLVQIPFAFVAGLILGFVTAESDSIWPAIIIHFINNFMSCVIDYVGIFYGENTGSFVFSIYLMVFLALGIVFAVVYTSKPDRKAFTYPKTPHITPKGKLLSYILFTPTNIIFYCIIVVSVILVQLAG